MTTIGDMFFKLHTINYIFISPKTKNVRLPKGIYTNIPLHLSSLNYQVLQLLLLQMRPDTLFEIFI